MINRFRRVIAHPLFSGSAMMVLGANSANAINYFYHLVIGRLLGPTAYGTMSSVFSFIILLNIVPASLSLVVVRYVSTGGSSSEVAAVISNLYRKTLLIGAAVFILCLVFSPYIAGFLNISSPELVAMAGLAFFFNLTTMLCRSVLQGSLRFSTSAYSMLIENSLKFIFSLLLVYFGWSVFGAVAGVVLAGFIIFLYTSILIRRFLVSTPAHISYLKPLLIYSVPVILLTVAYTSVFASDMLLVKHFLSPHAVGLYAALSTLAKIITFGTSPVIAVVFPLVARKQAHGEKLQRVFISGLLLTACLACTVLLIYHYFPGMAISVLYGPQYLEAVPFLFKFGLISTLFSLSSYLVNYHLSLNRVRIVILPVVASLFQIVGIWFWHSGIAQILNVSFWISLSLLVILMLDYGKIYYTKPAAL